MGHAIVNVIPLYKDIPLEKKKGDEKELKAIQEKLETKKRAPRKSSKKSAKKLPQIGFRIP
jgi:hypothetical protein